jgi:GNAT superfamily N-acetyltransferase
MSSSDGLISQCLVVRPATLADLRDVIAIRQSQELANGATEFTTADQLAGEWEALGNRLAQQVWVAVAADGSLHACAELVVADRVCILRLWAPLDHHNVGIDFALSAKAEEQACMIGREEGADYVTLFAQATSSRPEAQQPLLMSGYTLLSTYEKMELTLNAPPASPEDISGIEICSFAAGQDAEPIYRADEEAFLDQRRHTPRTFEQWKRRLNFDEETFDPSAWLIARDASEVAGAALGEVIQGIGWIHHLFVRRPWRRQGLGAALMLSILRVFHRQGIGIARLNVDAQSVTNARQLYCRLGFRMTGAYSNFEKVVTLA